MRIAFIIQARLGSSRLPGKILLPFYNQLSILDLLIEKLSQIRDTIILIATSESKENDKIEEVAKRHNITCYRGSENDVLKRFIDAAKYVNVSNIVRICSDNPFLDFNSIVELINAVKKNEERFDYVGYNIMDTPSIKTHYGFWAEYVTLPALEKVNRITDSSLYHEHVTNYIYEHPKDFKIKWILGSSVLFDHPNIRLTIDTQSDFKTAQTIYRDLIQNNTNFSIEQIVSYLDSHPEYYSLMEEQINKNSK